MAKGLVEKNNIQNIANAIRIKLNSQNTFTVANMADNILNIPTSSGGGDVKLFETIEQMNQSSGNKDGDLAIVYANSLAGIKSDTIFSKLFFPTTVTLSSAITTDAGTSFHTTSPDIYIDGWFSIDPSSCYISAYSMETSTSLCDVHYTSEDGIHYIRKSSSPSEVDFEISMQFESSEWDDRYSSFMLSGSVDFEGLFSYNDNNWGITPTQIKAQDYEVAEKTFYGKNGVEVGTLQNNIVNNKNALLSKIGVWQNLCNIELIDSLYNCSSLFSYNTNLVAIPNINTDSVYNMSYMFANCINLKDIPILNMNSVNSYMYGMFNNCNNLSSNSYHNIANSLPSVINFALGGHTLQNIGLNISNFDSNDVMTLANKGYIEALPSIVNSNNVSSNWRLEYYYQGEPRTVNINKTNNYDVNGMVLGPYVKNTLSGYSTNGTIYDDGNEGTLYCADNMFYKYIASGQYLDLVNIKTEHLYSMTYTFRDTYCNDIRMWNTSNVKIMYGTFAGTHFTDATNFDTSNVINMCRMFDDSGIVVNIPNYDTHNVQDMSYMFNNCNSLLNVPNFDTSNVTNMYSMFNNNRKFAQFPNFNFASVENTSNMFNTCYNMTSNIGVNLWCNNCLNAYRMFAGCSNMNNIIAINFDRVIDFSNAFQSCQKIVDMPQFYVNNATNICNAFGYCINLSNSSVQNIVNLVLNCNVTNTIQKNLSNANIYSPLYGTKFSRMYYSNRLTELSAAGWNY